MARKPDTENAIAGHKYHDLFEHAPIGYLTLAEDSRILETNLTAAQMLGYSKSELIKSSLDGLAVDPQHTLSFHIKKVLETGRRQNCELLLKKRDGTGLHVLLTSRPLKSGKKQRRVRTAITDISERKKTEEALKRSEKRFRALMEAGSDELFAMNPDWSEIRRLDRRGYRSVKENPVCNWFEDNIHPDDRSRVIAAVREAIRTKSVFELEHLVQRNDGGMGWSLSRAVPILNAGGEIEEWFGASSDITERKKTEQTKDEFLSLVSHELRTPLTVIKSSLKVALNERASPREIRELIQSAAENTDCLAGILENMLELTRHQTGRLDLMAEATDIGLLTEKVIDQLKSSGAKQKFEVSMPADLPMIEVDPLRLERILHNLLENAVKFSPAESPISVVVHQAGAFLVTGITDQGPGISKKDRKTLFQMFNRLGKPAAVAGSGLGLMVCLRLLEAHGGWIKVDSARGRGSTFSFGLPLPGAESSNPMVG